MYTVQELLNKAVKLIDDYPNILDYATDYFDDVTSIHTELVRSNIGIKPKEYYFEFDGTAYYSPSDTRFQAIPLPVDLTEDDQIISVSIDFPLKTETHLAALYLLVPITYNSPISVTYMEKAKIFSALSDVVQISDDAVDTVASLGLASRFASYNKPDYVDRLAARYEKAKKNWKSRGYNFSVVQDYYGGIGIYG